MPIDKERVAGERANPLLMGDRLERLVDPGLGEAVMHRPGFARRIAGVPDDIVDRVSRPLGGDEVVTCPPGDSSRGVTVGVVLRAHSPVVPRVAGAEQAQHRGRPDPNFGRTRDGKQSVVQVHHLGWRQNVDQLAGDRLLRVVVLVEFGGAGGRNGRGGRG